MVKSVLNKKTPRSLFREKVGLKTMLEQLQHAMEQEVEDHLGVAEENTIGFSG